MLHKRKMSFSNGAVQARFYRNGLIIITAFPIQHKISFYNPTSMRPSYYYKNTPRVYILLFMLIVARYSYLHMISNENGDDYQYKKR